MSDTDKRPIVVVDLTLDENPCERCKGVAVTTVKTRHFGVEKLCAGCAANVRRDGQEVD